MVLNEKKSFLNVHNFPKAKTTVIFVAAWSKIYNLSQWIKNFIERLVLSLTKKQSSVSWTHLYAVIRRLERRAKYSCQSPSGVHLPSQYFIMTAFLENISGKFLAHHHAALVIKLGKSLTQNSRKFPRIFHYRNTSCQISWKLKTSFK